jgi:hypothetical protein
MVAIEVKSGAGHPHQMSEVEQLVNALPGQDLRQRIRARDEVHFVIGKFGA